MKLLTYSIPTFSISFDRQRFYNVWKVDLQFIVGNKGADEYEQDKKQ